MDRLVAAIRANRYRFSDEKGLQDGLEQVLVQLGLRFEREARIAPGEVPDFLLEDGTAIEVKVDGSLSAVTRQLHRYAQHERVRALLLVTTRWTHARMPESMNGKPVRVLPLLGGLR
jgi:hypothetical protein